MLVPRISKSIGNRSFWQWLTIVWNNVDNDRIAQVGPDRACAEWLMKNGAFVKWTDQKEYLTDYNALPSEGEIHYIKEVDATDASISHLGFPYFKGCNHINKVRLQRCSYIDNQAMEKLNYLQSSLKQLQILSCGNVTDNGLKALAALSNLRSLLIYDLPYVKNKDECIQHLKGAIPECKIDYREGTEKEPEAASQKSD